MGLGAALQEELSVEQKASRVVRYHADSSLKDFKSARTASKVQAGQISRFSPCHVLVGSK